MDKETVETVPNLIALFDTGLKPGVNDRLHFQTFEAKTVAGSTCYRQRTAERNSLGVMPVARLKVWQN